MQELVLARSTRLFCGPDSSLWKDWEWTYSFLEDRRWLSTILSILSYGYQVDKMTQQVDGIANLLAISNLRQRKDEIVAAFTRGSDSFAHDPLRLWFINSMILVPMARSARCSDARDKIYGLLGIIDHQTSFSGSSHISIDYNEKPDIVFESFFAQIITHTQSLDVLGSVHRPLSVQDPSCPSWMPHYSIATQETSLLILYSGETPYCAALGLASPHKIDVVDRQLKCSGVLFDTVDDIAEFDLQKDYVMPLLRFARKLPPRVSGRRRLDHLWRTCILNQTYDGIVPAQDYFEKGFLAFLVTGMLDLLASDRKGSHPIEAIKLFVDLLAQFEFSENVNHRLDSSAIRDVFMEQMQWHKTNPTEKYVRTSAPKAKQMSNFAAEFRMSMTVIPTGRSLFRTKRGLLGIGTKETARGDAVWILKNTHTPFLLRSTSTKDCHRLVGDCFVLDHMHGECLSSKYGLKDKVQGMKIV